MLHWVFDTSLQKIANVVPTVAVKQSAKVHVPLVCFISSDTLICMWTYNPISDFSKQVPLIRVYKLSYGSEHQNRYISPPAVMFLKADPTFHSSVEWVDKPFSVHWSNGQCIIWCPRLQKLVKRGSGGFKPVNLSEKVNCGAAQKPSTLTTRPGRQGSQTVLAMCIRACWVMRSPISMRSIPWSIGEIYPRHSRQVAQWALKAVLFDRKCLIGGFP